MVKLDLDTFVLSDTHFFHDNIVKFCARDQQIAWLQHAVGVEQSVIDATDHNSYMLERWNAVVSPDDLVLHLGDVFFGRRDGVARMRALAPLLNGRKLLILGNHDKQKPSLYGELGFKVVKPFETRVAGQWLSFDHYPLPVGESAGKRLHLHGHIHNNGYPIEDGPRGYQAGNTPTREGHVNLSVEMIDYTPVRLADIVTS